VKIVLTVHQFVPDYSSGTEVLTFSVAKELLKRGHHVFVLTGFPARNQMADASRYDAYEIDGIKVFRFQHGLQPMGEQTVLTEIEYDNRLAAKYFAKILSDIQPDIVHFFHFSRLGSGLIDVAVANAIPAFYTPTDFWSVCPTSQLMLEDGSMCGGPSFAGGNCVKHIAGLTRGGMAKKCARLLPTIVVDFAAISARWGLGAIHPLGREVAAMSGRLALNVSRLNLLTLIFSPTKLMTEVLLKNGVRPQLIRKSAYGLEVDDYVNHHRQRPDRACTFGFIGTLAPHKGCHILIDAFKRLDASGLKLKIYGNPNDLPWYYEQLKQQAHGIDAIEFCGTFPNSKIAQVISEIDALVVPSLWYENTPLVVYSAHAARCPVVVSDYPGMSEVVHDQINGLVFPAGDVDRLADCLSRMAKEEGLLSRLSSECRSPKSIFEYVNEIEEEYRRVSSVESPIRAKDPIVH
jgi:glycosyltransferase involved in cell wall biosynthesis